MIIGFSKRSSQWLNLFHALITSISFCVRACAAKSISEQYHSAGFSSTTFDTTATSSTSPASTTEWAVLQVTVEQNGECCQSTHFTRSKTRQQRLRKFIRFSSKNQPCPWPPCPSCWCGNLPAASSVWSSFNRSYPKQMPYPNAPNRASCEMVSESTVARHLFFPNQTYFVLKMCW